MRIGRIHEDVPMVFGIHWHECTPEDESSHVTGKAEEPSDVAAAIDIWKERAEQLDRYGDDYKLTVNYKLTALKAIMHHREDCFEEKWEETDVP